MHILCTGLLSTQSCGEMRLVKSVSEMPFRHLPCLSAVSLSYSSKAVSPAGFAEFWSPQKKFFFSLAFLLLQVLTFLCREVSGTTSFLQQNSRKASFNLTAAERNKPRLSQLWVALKKTRSFVGSLVTLSTYALCSWCSQLISVRQEHLRAFAKAQ